MEAQLTFSLHFFCLLRNFPLLKHGVLLCPQMAWKGCFGDDQAGICVNAYCRMIDHHQLGRVQSPVSVCIIADTGGDEMEQFSPHSTSWSLENNFSCFVFLLVATTLEIPQFLKTPDPLLFQGLCKLCFFYPECSDPNLYYSFFREPSPHPLDDVSFFVLFLAVYIFHKHLYVL